MKPGKNFIVDFDSTFTKVEALDELAKISLSGRPERDKVLEEIKAVTDRGMDGTLSVVESLEHRIGLLKAERAHLTELIAVLKTQISDSFTRNKIFFDTYAENILIISGGFKEFIVPIVAELGILPENVYANTFVFDESDRIIGFDRENPLSRNGGKVELIRSLNLRGDIYVIGDGYTDYEIKKAGLANRFYAFTENVRREAVTENADHEAPSLDEFLYIHKLPMAISYPKSRINVLILENIHSDAADYFRKEGYNVRCEAGAMDEEELCEAIKNVSVVCIRSKTNVTRKVLESANKLISVGAFCIGTNQIDLKACSEKGVAVFNAPYSNTRSVVELAIAEIIMLMRNMPPKMLGMKIGKWEKSAANSFEIRGKTLGIIGYGNIGTQLSVLAEAMGMRVIYYDISEKLALGNAVKCDSIETVLRQSDVVSLHIDGRPANDNFFGEAEFALMKDGACFLNLARGKVVQIDALIKYMKNGKIRGAGVDVFPEEPKTNQERFVSELSEMENVILSPHIGGSTQEAQVNIANYVAGKIVDYINTGDSFANVSLPQIQLPKLANAHRLMHIHQNKAGILAKINGVFAKHGANITEQFLKTEGEIGYVITDVDKSYNKDVIQDLKDVSDTIRFRVLY